MSIVSSSGEINTIRLKEVYARAEDSRTRVLDRFRDAYRFFLPGRVNFTEEDNIILYDSTGQDALSQAAARLKTAVFPAGQKWLDFRPGPRLTGNERPSEEMRMGFARATNDFFMHLSNTNFEAAMSEALIDFVIGTCVIKVVMNVDGGLSLYAVPPHEVAIDNNPFGPPRNVFQAHTLIKEKIALGWPNARIPKSIEEKDDSDEVTVVEGDIADGSAQRYVVFEKESGDILVSTKMNRKTFLVARHTIASGEAYGRGPGIRALDTARTINALTGNFIKMVSFQSNPMIQIESSLLGDTPTLRPGVVIEKVSGYPGADVVKEIPIGRSWNPTQIQLEALRAQLEKVLAGSVVPPDTSAPKSARELVERQEERARADSQFYGRIVVEVFKPLVEILVRAFQSAGKFPKENFNVSDAQDIEVIVESPIAKNERLANVERNLAAVDLQLRSGVTVINPQSVYDDAFKDMGVEAKHFYSDEKKNELIDLAAAAAAQQAGPERAPGSPLQL